MTLPDRTMGQRLVLTAGLLAAGGMVVGLSLLITSAVVIGKIIHQADIAEGTDDPAPLLGVVPPPRQPEDAP